MAELSKEENKILATKYDSCPIGRMNDVTINKECMGLLMNISVITGWVIPIDPMRSALRNQLKLKLQEDYDMLNVDEITYAFRQIGTGIEDWGKEMNLNLVDKVLQPFVKKRFEVSKMEEQVKNKPPEQKIYTDEEINNERRGEIETAFQAMKKGYFPIIHDYFAEILIMDGFITDDIHLTDFFVHSLGNRRENIYTKE